MNSQRRITHRWSVFDRQLCIGSAHAVGIAVLSRSRRGHKIGLRRLPVLFAWKTDQQRGQEDQVARQGGRDRRTSHTGEHPMIGKFAGHRRAESQDQDHRGGNQCGAYSKVGTADRLPQWQMS